MQAVLDTSVFIAREQERPLGTLPEEVAVSVVTLSDFATASSPRAVTSRWRAVSALWRLRGRLLRRW